jgi:hypothetical protein
MGVNFRFMRYRDLSWHKQYEAGGRLPEGSSMNRDAYLKAVRVDGEVLVFRCWACGTEHCVNVEQCSPEELALMVCSKSNCRMSLFLVNELAGDEQTTGQMWASERNALFAALSRLWK